MSQRTDMSRSRRSVLIEADLDLEVMDSRIKDFRPASARRARPFSTSRSKHVVLTDCVKVETPLFHAVATRPQLKGHFGKKRKGLESHWLHSTK